MAMHEFSQERIDNALEELQLYNTEALPEAPNPMPVRPEEWSMMGLYLYATPLW